MSATTAQFAPIHIRLISGEIQTINVDVKQYIHVFPKDYANHFGYNPKVSHRFEFLIHSHEDDDHEPIRLLDHSNKTWLQLFSSVDDIPLIHLLIQSHDDKDLPDKIQLIRSIIKKERRKSDLSDDDIASHYQQWYLTYIPSGKTNRYLTLSQFVHDCPQLFPVYSLEEIQQVQDKYDALKHDYDEMKQSEKSMSAKANCYENVLALQRNTRVYMDKIAHFTPLQLETHEAHKAELRVLLENDPDCLFVHQMPDKIKLYRETIGCFVMMEMGVYNAGFNKSHYRCDCDLEKSEKKCSKSDMARGKHIVHHLTEFRSELSDENDTVIRAKIDFYIKESSRIKKLADRLWDNMEPLRDILFA
jgi:hypothetical protein